jgi:branched-subunit amino acid ABC-type transport system permease component
VSGILIAPITTLYYDTGFLFGLKGFVGAILGGMASYPLAAVGAIAVGLLESFSSFWASAFKVIVFRHHPVLVWRRPGTTWRRRNDRGQRPRAARAAPRGARSSRSRRSSSASTRSCSSPTSA